MQALINYINSFAKLDEEAIAAMKKFVEIETFAKNQHILEAGQRCHKIWYLKSGMVRKYYLHEGKEITAWVHTENEFFTSLQSYAHQTAANEYLQACEQTKVIGLTRQNSEKLASFPQFVIFSNTLMEQEFAHIDSHTKAFATKTAKEKYDYLRQIAPEITKRAKLNQHWS